MDRMEYLDKELSRSQKETYAKICESNKYTAIGHKVRTCNILMQLGLIKPDPDSRNANNYVLKGKPLTFTQALPLKKDIIKEISKAPTVLANNQNLALPEPKHKPIVWTPPATPPTVYSNISREQHVERWLNQPVKVKVKRFTPVKCLTYSQMEYIMDNHEQKSALEMADHLDKEKYEIILFCQANAIEPLQRKGKHINYNGPQKKTA